MVGLNVKHITAYFAWLHIDLLLIKSIVIVITARVYLIGLKIPQRLAPALRSTKVTSVNSVQADTHKSRLLEDQYVGYVPCQCSGVSDKCHLRLEYAWAVNAELQVWAHSSSWQYY